MLPLLLQLRRIQRENHNNIAKECMYYHYAKYPIDSRSQHTKCYHGGTDIGNKKCLFQKGKAQNFATDSSYCTRLCTTSRNQSLFCLRDFTQD